MILLRDRKYDAKNERSYDDRKWNNISWYILLWKNFWRHDVNSLEEYVVKIKWNIKWVYVWSPNDYCVRCKDWDRIWKYWIVMSSRNIFKSREECLNYYKDLFYDDYRDYIVDTLSNNILYLKSRVLCDTERIVDLEQTLEEFNKNKSEK